MTDELPAFMDDEEIAALEAHDQQVAEEEETRKQNPKRRRKNYLPETRGGVYEVMPYGTGISPSWQPEWVEHVTEYEAIVKRPICGAHRTPGKIAELTDEEKAADRYHDLCKSPAGARTDHLGEGRCAFHGGNNAAGSKTTLLRNQNIAWKIQALAEDPDIADTSRAIATAWAAIDASLHEDEDITPERAMQIVGAMSKIGTLNKQHNDIQSSKKLTIDIHEFMVWAEHLYEMAIKYIAGRDGNVAGFISEAESFFSGTIQSITGVSSPSVGDGGAIEAGSVARSGVEESGSAEGAPGPDLLRGEVHQAPRREVDEADSAVPEGHGASHLEGFAVRPANPPALPTS